MSNVTMTDADFKKVEAAIRQDERSKVLAMIEELLDEAYSSDYDPGDEVQEAEVSGAIQAFRKLKARMTEPRDK